MNNISNDDIKARVSVVDAAQCITQVWSDGRNRWVCRCLCGRSEDKTPSFKLWDDHAHCFSCQLHIANVFQLVMLAIFRNPNFNDRSSFIQAREWLIREFFGAGMTSDALHEARFKPEPMEAPPASPEIKALLNATTEHYVRVLWGDPDQPELYPGKPEPLDYLRRKRGLSDATIRRLRIGYADNLGLARALYRAGFDLALAARAGVLSTDDKGEFLRGRIVFPVLNTADDAVYLIGRGTQAWQAKTKYLGLPQTLVRKVPMVAGTAKCGVILVEGPVDFAALMQWGLEADYLFVCSLGTAHTRAIEVIRECAPGAVTLVATDQDHAGEESSGRILRRLGELGRTGVRVRWANAKDCGEWLAQGARGEEVFLAALHTAECRTANPYLDAARRETFVNVVREALNLNAQAWPDAMLEDSQPTTHPTRSTALGP